MNNQIKELDEFAKKIKANAQNPLPGQTMTMDLTPQVLKELYRIVILNVSPLVEEQRELLNLFGLYLDVRENPNDYTKDEREYVTAAFRTWADQQKEFIRKKP